MTTCTRPRGAPQACSVYDLSADRPCERWAWYRDQRSGMWLCGAHCPTGAALGRPRVAVMS